MGAAEISQSFISSTPCKRIKVLGVVYIFLIAVFIFLTKIAQRYNKKPEFANFYSTFLPVAS